jgi:hypothetical protein
MDRYAETWAEYRTWRNWALLVTFGFPVIMYLLGFVLRRLLRPNILDYLWGALILGWFFGSLVLGQVVQSLVCPRCGKALPLDGGTVEAFFSPARARIAGCESMRRMGVTKVDLAVGRA